MRAAFDLYDDPMATLAELEAYAAKTSSALIDLAGAHPQRRQGSGRWRAHRPRRHRLRDRRAAARVAAPCRPRQLYVPVDMLQRHGAQAEDVFAGERPPSCARRLPSCALRARQHLAAARGHRRAARRGDHAGAAAGRAGAAGARPDGAARLRPFGRGAAAMAAAMDSVARGAEAVAHLQLVGSARSRRLRRSATMRATLARSSSVAISAVEQVDLVHARRAAGFRCGPRRSDGAAMRRRPGSAPGRFAAPRPSEM